MHSLISVGGVCIGFNRIGILRSNIFDLLSFIKYIYKHLATKKLKIMKNLALGVIFSMFVTVGSIASVSAGNNFPGGKKKKCKTEKGCSTETKKSCCPSKSESKDCGKKSEAQ